MYDGFLNLLKPPGLTSHDLVAWVRRALDQRRVGHLGTLDPAAAGVLPISLGRATRLLDYAEAGKAYRALIVFGLRTDTMDAEGQVLARGDAAGLTEARLAELLPRFLGEIEQVPPAFSAAQVGGQRLYARARAGDQRGGTPKRVTITSLELWEFAPGQQARAWVDVSCGPGTYIRALADELGEAAGCGAYLGFLVRTRAGRFALEDAVTMEELWPTREHPASYLLPMDHPLSHPPEVRLDAPDEAAFLRGQQSAGVFPAAAAARVYGPARGFLGVGEVQENGRVRPKVVLASEEVGDT
jgi:tRNA pseudouridine55 synthase